MIILIAGGSSGIGKYLVDKLSKYNTIITFSRSIEEDINKNMYKYKCDGSNENDIIKLYNNIYNNFNYVDVVINCIGIQGEIGKIHQTDSKSWLNTIINNTYSSYLLCKYFIDMILKSKYKKIINFAGGGAFNPFSNYSAYSVSKVGVVRLTENIAEEYRNEGINANCISPGFIDTNIHKSTLNVGYDKAGINYNKTINRIKNGEINSMDNVFKVVEFLINNNINGKTISAVYDDVEDVKNKNNTNWYTLRRVDKYSIENL